MQSSVSTAQSCPYLAIHMRRLAQTVSVHQPSLPFPGILQTVKSSIEAIKEAEDICSQVGDAWW